MKLKNILTQKKKDPDFLRALKNETNIKKLPILIYKSASRKGRNQKLIKLLNRMLFSIKDIDDEFIEKQLHHATPYSVKSISQCIFHNKTFLKIWDEKKSVS